MNASIIITEFYYKIKQSKGRSLNIYGYITKKLFTKMKQIRGYWEAELFDVSI